MSHYMANYVSADDHFARNFLIIMFSVIALFFVWGSYSIYAYNYTETTKPTPLLIGDFKIRVDERMNRFEVKVTGAVEGRFSCQQEPVKKEAMLTYRMAEFKTSSGKYKIKPVFDGKTNCDKLINS